MATITKDILLNSRLTIENAAGDPYEISLAEVLSILRIATVEAGPATLPAPTPAPVAVSTAPAKTPDSTATPAPAIIKPTREQLLGPLVGHFMNEPVYKAEDGNWYYQETAGKLWPRGTDLNFTALPGANLLASDKNPTPGNFPGAPMWHTLPSGWGWYKSKDENFAIVPELTTEPGPIWLQSGAGNKAATATGATGRLETVNHYQQMPTEI